MKLAEALSIVHKTPAELPEFGVVLACGVTPLHLQNFFAAHLQTLRADRKVRVSTGLFGDLAGTLEHISGHFSPHQSVEAVAVVMEWSDLDPRLGFRHLGGWGQKRLADSVSTVQATLQRVEQAMVALPKSATVAVSLPTLSLPPGFHTVGWQASAMELALEHAVADFASRLAMQRMVRVVNRSQLDLMSPAATRYDARADLNSGFPYTNAHADVLGNALAELIAGPAPKKGLITDLDDTFWAGLVGEIGHENVAWDLSSHAQLHGLYQQMLATLADHGVLLAIASKNSPEVVELALGRSDLAIRREQIYPTEVHWDAKSGSVARILKTWNIGADAVVFIDDSPLELEEVREAHPGIECLLFPKNDPAAGTALLRRLRDLFGKATLSEEDSFRLESIRAGQELAKANGTSGSAEHFLAGLNATITLEFNPPSDDRRVLELVNKTNQFNLNGLRYTEAEWAQVANEEGAFVLAVSYADKFGPLGKIAVLQGRQHGAAIQLRAWVMSCRAFSRRIEHACLMDLFGRFEAEEITVAYKATAKNGPTREFLMQFSDAVQDGAVTIRREDFEARRPKLYHTILESHGER